jgi:outer membrane lipoprotein-sorting protein
MRERAGATRARRESSGDGRWLRALGACCALALVVLPLIVASAPAVRGEELSAEEIAQRAYDRDEGDDVVLDQKMILSKKGKSPRIRLVRMWAKEDEQGNRKSLLRFLEPADVRDTGFLVWSYAEEGKSDDQWLYLPALKRVRRIAARERSRSFMGTDFTYDDLGDRKPSEDRHTLLGEEKVDGRPCYKIEAVPRDPGYVYSRRVAWIDKENFLILKGEFYDKQGKLLKRFHATEIEVIDGIPTPKRLEMVNVQTGHSTVLELSNIRYNTGLSDDLFTQRELQNP